MILLMFANFKYFIIYVIYNIYSFIYILIYIVQNFDKVLHKQFLFSTLCHGCLFLVHISLFKWICNLVKTYIENENKLRPHTQDSY